MKDSSAVKPDLYDLEQQPIPIDFIETVDRIEIDETQVIFKTNRSDFILMFYQHGIIRIATAPEVVELDRRFYLEPIEPIPNIEVKETEEEVIVSHDGLRVEVYKSPFQFRVFKNNHLKYEFLGLGFQNQKTYLISERHVDDYIYGLGEKTGFLNKNNESTVNWNSDIFDPHTRSTKALYQSINMFIHRRPNYQYGMFIDNGSKMTFDFDTDLDKAVVTTELGTFDAYLYTGDTLKEIVQQHSYVTGKTFLPPLWALGYHQSRHSYRTTDEVRTIYNEFKTRKIPVDAIYLDILYMDQYKVFTFNPETYEDVEEMVQEFKEDGVRIVPIVDPGVKVQEGYAVYDKGLKEGSFCTYPDGTVFTGDVWPGKSAFYDFLNSKIRKRWGELHQFYTDLGIEGIWNDMNEPSVFNTESKTLDLDVVHNIDGTIKSHEEVHNLYGIGMCESTYEGLKKLTNKRPFILTRSGYAGVQKYAVVWTGDNRSSWEHLEMALPMCLNLSLSGVVLCGTDIGGFMDNTTEELLIRWFELGVFMPFFRNHSSIGLKYQEPWRFGERAEDIIKRYIELRYELIRYIYSEIYKSHLTGLPMMRPMVFDYEDDPETRHLHDQYMFGENLLVAPILRPGETVRKVYLPKGIWYNFFTGERVEGGKHILVRANLEQIPVFVRGGSVIPMGEKAMNTEKLSRNITIKVYLNGEDFTETIYFDDGITLDDRVLKVTVNVKGDDVDLELKGYTDLGFKFTIETIK